MPPCAAASFIFLIAASVASAGASPTLAVSGDRFVIDGQARFCVLVSYFDALRADQENIEEDFRWLEQNGIDGLRIFPNWWDETLERGFPKDTLMDASGNLRQVRLSKLKEVLNAAAAHHLIVDLSFAYETVEGLSALRKDQVGRPQGELPVNQVNIDAYEHALTALALELRPFKGLFIDIQNEFNGRVTHLSVQEATRLIAAIKKVDPARIATASLANEISAVDVARKSDEIRADVIAWHESRNPWAYDAMDSLVKRAKSVSTKPLYLGEPASMEDTGLGADAFLIAVSKAKSAGAAGWTFHTEHGFDLCARTLVAQLSPSEREFLTRVKNHLDGVPWGYSR